MERSIRSAVGRGLAAAALMAFGWLAGACAHNPVFPDPGGLKNSRSGTVSGMVAQGVYDNPTAEQAMERELNELRQAAVYAADEWAIKGMPSADHADNLYMLAKFKRDRYAARMLAYIDEYHEQTMSLQYYTTQSVRGVGQIASIASAFVATVAGAEATKTVFAGISTVLQGAGSTIDEQFLQKHSMLAIQSECTVNRLESRNLISTRLQAGVDGYSVEQLDADLTSYFHSGSLVNALISLSENAQSRLRVAKQNRAFLDKQAVDGQAADKLLKAGSGSSTTAPPKPPGGSATPPK